MIKYYSINIFIPLRLLNTLFSLLFLLFTLHGLSQDNVSSVNPDLLKSKSFEELKNLCNQSLVNADFEKLSSYRSHYLKRAKSLKNEIETARAYYYFISWGNLEQDLLYCDSIIRITKNSKHEAYPTNGYLLKADLYYNNSEFGKALDNYIIANDWANKKHYKPLQLESLLGIAAIKNVWGLHKEALDIYRANYLETLKLPNYLKNHYDDYMLLTNNLSLSYIRNDEPDSALVVSAKAMNYARSVGDMNSYFDLGKAHATANFYLKKYPNTLDSLLKFSDNYSDIELADSYYMMAKVYQYKNNHKQAILYYKKIDSIHKIINDPFPELKEVYNDLYKYASKWDDNDTQLYYLNQLITVDSILDLNYNKVNEKMRLDYDIPKFKEEKLNLTKKLKVKQQQLWLYSILSLLFLTVIITFYYSRQRKLKNRLHKLLQTEVIETSELILEKPKTNSLEISEDIMSDVLKQLTIFEKTKGYLSKDITLYSLAKEFNTNSTYLSSIINQEKQVNFATYLKNLRIMNAINELKSNREFLKYSMNGLAEQFGFFTAESFSKSFREKTGIKPSYFLDELRKEK